MQVECQEIVGRRAKPNAAATVPLQTPSGSKPRVPNAPGTNPQRLDDPKRLSLIAKKINEAIGVVNSVETSFSSGGTVNDSALNGLMLEDQQLPASPDELAHTSDDIIAAHSD